MFLAIAFSFALTAHGALVAPASELVGKYVIDPARADLGRVHDLIGWAGIFDKQFAIPIEEFTPAPYSDKLVLSRAKDLLLVEPGVDLASGRVGERP